MSKIERNNFIDVPSTERFLYQERPFEYVDQALTEIKQLESGEKEKIKLSPEDREFLFEIDKSLETQLRPIYAISPRSTTLYLDYFATPEGKTALRDATGIDLQTANVEEIRKIIWQNDRLITDLNPPQKRIDLADDSRDFADTELLRQMLSQADEKGRLDLNNIHPKKRIQPVINPEEALQKIQLLRDFKENVLAGEMRRLSLRIRQKEDSLSLAVLEVFGVYRRRVNEMIMDMYQYGLSVSQKRQAVGEEGLSGTERQLFDQFSGLSDPSSFLKNRSRIDRVWHGASRGGFYEKKWRIQISEEMISHMEKLASLYEAIELSKSENIKAMGLDEEKLNQANIPPKETAKWAEEVLAGHNLKSAYPRETCYPDRKGPAPDGKWQIELLPGETTMSVDYKRKTLKDSAKKQKSIIRTLANECGHEPTHILQGENQSKIKSLELFKTIGGSGFEIFSEGGAKKTENNICRLLFGFEQPSFPHYTRAMLRKLKGGNYIDCVGAYYESCIAPIRKRIGDGTISRNAFDARVKKALETAIDSSKRLFANGTDFESNEPFLTNSRDTAYMEQHAVFEKLEKSGFAKLGNLRGMGLRDIVSMVRLDEIKLDDLIEYNYEPIKAIWEREKPKYLLKESA